MPETQHVPEAQDELYSHHVFLLPFKSDTTNLDKSLTTNHVEILSHRIPRENE